MKLGTSESPVTLDQKGNPASLFLFDDRIIWTSVGFHGRETMRPAIALLVGAYKELTITTNGTDVYCSRAMLVAANVNRSLEAEHAGFYGLILDPVHPARRYLMETVLRGQDVVDLSAHINIDVTSKIVFAIEQAVDCTSALKLSDQLLMHFFPDVIHSCPIDPRVEQAAAWLRKNVPTRVDLEILAETCHLSEGRLTHLFTDELGISIRTYLLWVKMRRAAALFAQDMSLTDVASAIGFADSAHLSRVFRTYFSATPSFLANRALVRVSVCTASSGITQSG